MPGLNINIAVSGDPLAVERDALIRRGFTDLPREERVWLNDDYLEGPYTGYGAVALRSVLGETPTE